MMRVARFRLRPACIAFVGTLLCLAPAGLARAGDMPSFFADGQKYMTDLKACTAEDGETDALQLTARGLFGYEFGCTFVDIHPVRYDDDSEVTQYLAIAACGDDSGISRPDNLVITDNGDGSLRVTSQNEYLTQLIMERDGETDTNWIVEREFNRCPAN